MMSWLIPFVSLMLAIVLFCIGGSLRTAADQEEEMLRPLHEGSPSLQHGETEAYYAQDELLAMVESEAEADEIARLYNIELKSVTDGLAVFSLQQGQDVMALIELGMENGWPTVQPNYIYQTFHK